MNMWQGNWLETKDVCTSGRIPQWLVVWKDVMHGEWGINANESAGHQMMKIQMNGSTCFYKRWDVSLVGVVWQYSLHFQLELSLCPFLLCTVTYTKHQNLGKSGAYIGQ
jgi:hypothetical protein